MPTYKIIAPYTAKSRPILFKGEMIRAILDGRKTQTRRVIKAEWSRCLDLEEPGDLQKAIDQCPYGKIGDFLWVKESFRAVNEYGGNEWTTFAYPKYKDGQIGRIASLQEDYFYKKIKWQSPIFMPRWASRISLKIMDVRVDRLQSISYEYIKREGIQKKINGVSLDMKVDFYNLWDSINAKKGYGWDENPWVFIISFERIEDE